jgi:hypothetical protein
MLRVMGNFNLEPGESYAVEGSVVKIGASAWAWCSSIVACKSSHISTLRTLRNNRFAMNDVFYVAENPRIANGNTLQIHFHTFSCSIETHKDY